MTSLLGLLAEYGVWPRVANATAISSGIKHLHDQLQWKTKACNVSSLSCSFPIEQPLEILNFSVYTHFLGLLLSAYVLWPY
jgi:hypothetical protein